VDGACVARGLLELKHVLGEIETYCRDMHWSGSLSGAEAITPSHRALPGDGAVHSIIYRTRFGLAVIHIRQSLRRVWDL
jgi:hypothetical protein